MKKFMLCAMLFIASISFANTISDEIVEIKATEPETKEVSIDSNLTNTMVVVSEEDWCRTVTWHVIIRVEPHFSGGYLVTYLDWSYEVCYDF